MGADYKIIHDNNVIKLFVDMTMHEAVALADYLVKCNYEVNEVRIQTATKTTLIILGSKQEDRLIDTLSFYYKHI